MCSAFPLPRLVPACGLNVHKRCERMVPHNCGVNQKELAQALQEMGVTPDKLKPKASIVSAPSCVATAEGSAGRTPSMLVVWHASICMVVLTVEPLNQDSLK